MKWDSLPITICLLLNLLSGFALAQLSPTEYFLEGNDALERNEAAEAVRQYETALDAELHSAELYHNLGLAYLQLDRTGPAVYHLSRAAQLAPGDDAIARSLEYARTQIREELPTIRAFFPVRWFRAAGVWLSATAWAIFAQLLLLIAVGLAVYWQLGSDRQRRKRAFYGAVALVPLVLLTFALADYRDRLDHQEERGVLLTDSILRTAPDATSDSVLSVTEGNAFAIDDRVGDWYRVTLSNGETGWLEEETVGVF